MTEIKLITSQMLYDIRNIAYVEGHLMEDSDTCLHKRHLVTDIAEDGNIDIVSRALLLAYAGLQWALTRADFTAAPRYTDILKLPRSFVLPLNRPLSHARATLLTQLAHHFMVASALCHWLSIVNGEAAARWRTRADEYETRISALAASAGVTTRHSSPF